MAAANVPDDLQLVSRLACLGSEDGTFHVLRERAFSPDQTESIRSVLSMNRGHEVIKRLKTIANQKCYVKKENILFSLATIIENCNNKEDDHTNDLVCKEAYGLVQELCETSSDLFTFVNLNSKVRPKSKASWGRGMRKLISTWYESKPPQELARQTTQYKSGFGYCHRDLIKLTHMKCDEETKSKGTRLILKYLLYGKKTLDELTEADKEDEEAEKALSVLRNVEKLRLSQVNKPDTEAIRNLIEENNLIGKQIPTHFLNIRETFVGLLGHMPLTLLVKSIPRMAMVGVLCPMGHDAQKVVDKLTDAKAIRQERLCPVTVFRAMKKYDKNKQRKWTRNPVVCKALRDAYNMSLENVMSTGKRYLLAVNIAIDQPRASVTGSSFLAPVMPPAVMAQILAQVEENVTFTYFTTPTTKELTLKKNMGSVAILEQILTSSRDAKPNNDDYDICDPVKWATELKKEFDCILVICSKKKLPPNDELQDLLANYRVESGISDAKLAVIGLSDPATTIPRRDDINFLDVTGFNEDIPDLVQQFFKGLPSVTD